MFRQVKPDFADYIYTYFTKYLPLQRGLSSNTISSYSYSLLQFYHFCDCEKGIPCDKLTLDKIDKRIVEDYLFWMESTRKNSASTRNQRLSALKSLFQYIRSESVIYTALCCDILSVPEKKTPTVPPQYLSLKEMEVLFSMPDARTKHGRRDLTILLVLYDTAARVSELIELRVADISVGKTMTVKLFGKGNKTRIIPITQKTSDILQGYMNENHITKMEQLLFENRSHGKLTTAGISYILKKYVSMGKQVNSNMFNLNISPHLLRSTKASHLIQAGANIYYIRDFLGHKSVLTTERYARNNPEVVRNAITKASSDLTGNIEYYDNSEKTSMLSFLKSLQ